MIDFRQYLQPPQISDYQSFQPRRNIYRAGDPVDDVPLICDGWAARVMRLPEGRRQILSFLLPGEFFSPTALFQESFDFDVDAITTVRLGLLKRSELKAKFASEPDFMAACVSKCISEERRTDRVIASLGRRTADERIARFVLRFMERLGERDLVRDQSFQFPLSQQWIADAVGLTAVHVSRAIGALRKAGLIEVKEGTLRVLDLAGLRRIGSYESMRPARAIGPSSHAARPAR